MTALGGLQGTIERHELVAGALEKMGRMEWRAADPAHKEAPLNVNGAHLNELMKSALLAGELDQAREIVLRAQVPLPDVGAFHKAWDAVGERVKGASLDNVFPPTAGVAHVDHSLDVAARMLLSPFARTRLLEHPVFLSLPDRIRALPSAEQDRVWPRLIRTRMDLHQHAAACHGPS